jgi:hypothetical protein
MSEQQPSKENLEMQPFTLEAPVITMLSPKSNGYLFCPNCGTYEHHAFRWCQQCTVVELIRVKHLSIRSFIMLTARHGSGPKNTLSNYLFGDYSVSREKQPEWKHKLWKEAINLFYNFGGKTSGRSDSSNNGEGFSGDGWTWYQGDYAIPKNELEEKERRGLVALLLYKEGKLR